MSFFVEGYHEVTSSHTVRATLKDGAERDAVVVVPYFLTHRDKKTTPTCVDAVIS